ncbi:MAG TPA: SDR family oxidoreductase [Bacteroidia bacterium]|nr:SDR family oxidoreductase [Bacteroidia bacterium]HNS11526.1 SDR family oxidoreductase [Bacteroidia bacterium]
MRNKVVLITGSTGGIGKALAEKFAAEGSKVIISGRQHDALHLNAESIKKKGGSAFVVPADVSKESDCERLVKETIQKYGSIDVLINNAGISMRALFEDVDLEVIRKVMDVNFWGAVYTSKFALPYLLKSKGSLVGISSIAGKKGLPGRCAYSASKFALEGLLETIRTENLKKDLHVLVACPGFTASGIREKSLSKDGTAQGESPRNEKEMMTAEKVAERIYNAVKHRKRDLVLTRDGKLSVFLNKFFPSWMDGVVYNHMAKETNSPFKK